MLSLYLILTFVLIFLPLLSILVIGTNKQNKDQKAYNETMAAFYQSQRQKFINSHEIASK